MELTITRPDDWHLHFRDHEALGLTVPDTARYMARAIVMPNLTPPVVNAEQAQAYFDRITAATPAQAQFKPLMVLYLTNATTVQDIIDAKNSGVVVAAKLYPAGATTNLTVTGGGDFNISNTSATVDMGLANSNQGSTQNQATVDLTGLGSFTADVDNFRVGYGSTHFEYGKRAIVCLFQG